MKRFAFILVLLCTLLTFVGCKGKYPPVESTDEEKKVVMTLSFDGEKYEVKYELYRALFLNYKSTVDGGNSEVWSGDTKSEYVAKINDMIVRQISTIYAVLHHSEEIGLEPYSKEIDKEIEEQIRIGVEGNSADISGFGGDYDAYLASLKEMNLNYSTQVLLLRYSIMLDKINEYYLGVEDPVLGHMPGGIEVKETDVRNYYFSDESARILHAYLQAGTMQDAYERMVEIKGLLEESAHPIDAALVIINNTAVSPTDLIYGKEVGGIMVGKYTLEENFYIEYNNAVFSLAPGDVSEIIEVNDGTKGYYLIYKLDKDEAHFESKYDDIKLSYIENVIGKKINHIREGLSSNVQFKSDYERINHKDISID